MATKRQFKSKKKLSGSRAVYRAWSDWEVGDYIIGEYKGERTDNYDKPNWLFKVEEASFVSAPKEAKKLIGQVIGLNSNGMLNRAMEKVTEGDLVQVTYNGTSEIEKGKYKGKDAHLVEVDLVEVDDGSEADEYEESEDDEEESEDDL